MRITVNGVEVPVPLGGTLEVHVDGVDPGGAVLPPLTITASGGRLDIHRSRLSTAGTAVFDLFQEGK